MGNSEARAYAIIAVYNICRNRGYSFEKAKEMAMDISSEMSWLFDIKTENEAEKIANKIRYAQGEKDVKGIYFG